MNRIPRTDPYRYIPEDFYSDGSPDVRIVPNHTSIATWRSYPTDLTRWLDALLTSRYLRERLLVDVDMVRPSRDVQDRIVRRFLQLMAPPRPYLPGDPRMDHYRPERDILWAWPQVLLPDVMTYHQMSERIRQLSPEIVDRMRAGLERHRRAIETHALNHPDQADD